MDGQAFDQRRRLEMLSAGDLAELQLNRLNQLLKTVLPHNHFYAEKLAAVTHPLPSLVALSELPFTYKGELVSAHQTGDLAANLTWPVERYVRLHRTSGTLGRPLVVLDTAEDWQWWIDTWQFVLDAAQVSLNDLVMMAFSFGPFIGFWSAYDALVARGAMVIPGGGMNTEARLELLCSCQATVLCCTPTYALHMAEVAAKNQIDTANSSVRCLIVAGEPGGSIPAVRDHIQSAWGAKVIDHSGATEVGPWGYADTAGRGLHVIESEFIAEFLSVETGQAAAEGELSELVLTTLGRYGCPIIRYRTGDLVRPTWNVEGPNQFVLLDGGVLGRTDDMMVIRGVNIFPSSVEQILRGFPEIVEYRITVFRHGEMDALHVEVEDRMGEPDRVARELRLRLGLKAEVQLVPLGSLPRFEGKGRRFIDQRKS